MTDLLGYGAYVPRYRIGRAEIAGQYGHQAGSGETAVPAHDEDVTTMAVEAATDALAAADAAATDLDAVYAATTSDPFDERGVAPHVAHAVGAPDQARVGDFQGSARAATNALLAAIDAVAAGRAGTALVTASDVLVAEPGSTTERTAGAGAGAVVIGADDVVAQLVDDAVVTTGFVGRFTPAEGTTREGDGRFNRTAYLRAITDAIAALDGAGFDRAAFPAADGRWGVKAASAADLDVEHASTFDAVGYAAAGGVLLDLAALLDEAAVGERLLLAGYGPGGCDAVVLERTSDRTPPTTVAALLARGETVPYGTHRHYRETRGVA